MEINLIHEREHIISIVFRKLGMQKELTDRWQKLNYTPKPIQLKLEL